MKADSKKIVDSQFEQNLLESLLESSKPLPSLLTDGLDYLLATPFRYAPLRGGSCFRSNTDPDIFFSTGQLIEIHI